MAETKEIAAAPASPVARNVFAYPGYLKLLSASLLGALGDRFYQGLMIATANEIFQGKTVELKELGSVRNRHSDAHGAGRRSYRVTARHAALAVNLAGSMALFLIGTHEARNSGD